MQTAIELALERIHRHSDLSNSSCFSITCLGRATTDLISDGMCVHRFSSLECTLCSSWFAGGTKTVGELKWLAGFRGSWVIFGIGGGGGITFDDPFFEGDFLPL